MIVQIELEDMHKHLGYPKEILDFDWSVDSESMGQCLNYGVWDLEKGTVLKLGEGCKVLRAMKGMKMLNKEEI